MSHDHLVVPTSSILIFPTDGTLEPVVELPYSGGLWAACWVGDHLYGGRYDQFVFWEIDDLGQTRPVATIRYSETMTFGFSEGRWRVDQVYHPGDEWDPGSLTLGVMSVDDPLNPVNEGTLFISDFGIDGARLLCTDPDRLAVFFAVGAGVVSVADTRGGFARGQIIGYGGVGAVAGEVLWTYGLDHHDLVAFDITDVTAMTQLSGLPLPILVGDDSAISLADDRLVIESLGQLMVVDTSDPFAPVLLAAVDPGLGLVPSLRREGDVLFYGHGGGLAMFTGIDAGDPVVADQLALPFTPAGMCRADGDLVVHGATGFQVLEADPVDGLSALSPFVDQPSNGTAYNLGYLYLVVGVGAQAFWSLADPADPRFAGSAQGAPDGGSPAFVGGCYLSGSSVFLPQCDPVLAADHVPVPATGLAPVYPNPFNPRTAVAFELARAGRVSVTVHDVQGRLVVTLVDEHLEPGYHQAIWSGTDGEGRALASGVYLVRLQTGASVQTAKAVLVR